MRQRFWQGTFKTLGLLGLTAGLAAQAAEPSGKALSAAAGVPWPAVIAHRGASYDAPEETAAAYLLARDLGADYLEADVQRSRDGVLVALHDDTLERTTDVAEVFPGRAKDPVSSFTLAELKRLDAGSWFNRAFPERARPGFVGLRILTLDEMLDIAEGGANKPGLYLETKVPAQFPGIEDDLRKLLERRGWLQPRERAAAGHVDVAHGNGRVILQTFEKSSLELLQESMPQVPKILLLWLGDGYLEARSPVTFKESGETDKAAFYARQEVKSEAEFGAWLDWAKSHGALGTGPSATLSERGEQSYADLVKPWMNRMTHARGLFIHAYSVDSAEDFEALGAAGVDGFFTNRTSELLKFQGRPAAQDMDALLRRHGY
ncbi:TPA: glycerophosphodiester phosphodiesterase [Pseudomonas aeruginosa]|uniref:glycerophosphodiester phosphodiesterase n=1 Tax=Pseudomonas aeruginosa TaxID=287 RepID=UPI000F5431B3|nr:glycerophosphodiester phosphodiesterase [Pseudomonas aeruginosa]MBU8394497.1 glycerophosphodiester phosphodiesterase [Pseudomonas aeruginosa]MCV4187987.1 glycerophosphodiester phosphodiesterase [Pseudomonas aeruginosa]NTS95441.1 glycerophosphodiester phosphodiesterase [Pseudomonas aeruginosa]QIZ26430.1 glycerophosphodiester phosphodiesterase [Pseudomonas aeruginosa]RPM79985.1 glycerophosphodiester phosphodiesterase [Pseudomonas aeruginosa]